MTSANIPEHSAMQSLQQLVQVQTFLFDYAAALDEERFDDWVALFETQDCRYEVLSRENRDLGLPLAIMGCYSHGMIRDRVAMLVKGVLTYRRYQLLRQISNVRVRSQADGSLRADAALVVMAVKPQQMREAAQAYVRFWEKHDRERDEHHPVDEGE